MKKVNLASNSEKLRPGMTPAIRGASQDLFFSSLNFRGCELMGPGDFYPRKKRGHFLQPGHFHSLAPTEWSHGNPEGNG